MTQSRYRLEVLVRLAETGRRRAARSFAGAVAIARSHAEHAEHLAVVAATLRDAATTHGTTGTQTTVDAQRRSDAHVRCQAGRSARAEGECARASERAVLAGARVAELCKDLTCASRVARLQKALRDAAMSRMNLERQRSEARQANSDALDAWLARRIVNDD